ncbi:MAG TPA: NADPH:quinone reductase [Coleofasciculaceae cyanobacterium]
MKAAWYTQLGQAQDVLTVGEIDRPPVQAGEVLVKVHASGINPSDVKQRSGWGGLKMRYPRVIPHNDGAGVIAAVGEGISPDRLGERVWIYEATLRGGSGTAAEYVAVPSENAVPLPETTSFAAAACLGVPAMTAHHCLFKTGAGTDKDAVKGKTVLVTGGAGAVGNYAIQLAKWGGATVITTVSSEAKAEIAQAAGADYILNYKTEDIASRIRERVGSVDRIVEVDFAGNLATSLKVLKTNSAIATYASDSEPNPQIPIYSLIYKNLTVDYVLVYAMTRQGHVAAAQDINTCLSAGILRPVIGQQFTLEQIAEAHEMQERGQAIGKLILEI